MNNKLKTNRLVCPFCDKELSEQLIVSEAARINGRKGGGKLTSELAREMRKKRKPMTREEASRVAKLGWITRRRKINEQI